MKINCLTTFKDGRDTFEAGDVRTVDDARGAYFVAHGWAAPVGGDAAAPAAQPETDLNINSSTIGQGTNHG